MKRQSTIKGQDNQAEILSLVKGLGSEDLQEIIGNRAKQAIAKMGLELLESEVEELCGSKFSRKSASQNYRGGSEDSYILLDGSKEKIRRPRVRNAEGEIELTTLSKLQDRDLFDERIKERLLLGISSRKYEAVLSAWSDKLGVSKSSVSRAFTKASQQDLDTINGEDLSGQSFVAIMLDGLSVSGSMVIVALGIDSNFKKIPIGLTEGDTENAEVVKDLLSSIVARNFKLHCDNLLAVIDGSKALAKALKDVWGKRVVIQRCWLHKYRNIQGYLPEKHHPELKRRLKRMMSVVSYKDGLAEQKSLQKWLEHISGQAAASLAEVGEQLLTLHKLGLPEIFRKSLNSTNAIESFIGTIRAIKKRVKNWTTGKESQQTLRWTAASIMQAKPNMKKISGAAKKDLLMNALNNVDEIKLAA